MFILNSKAWKILLTAKAFFYEKYLEMSDIFLERERERERLA
jgi:hypothetical protein